MAANTQGTDRAEVKDAIDIDSLHRMQQSLHEIIAREAGSK